ncbi:LacI family DNA-binding transcriptional regulator [Agrococcus jenensis]|uniref:LacI family transcriptional regulator n=1 Tax=Agrococcus jenensis TaxID=46353 RepID=A0A3N2AQ97_9MICO|nr:LacI family DNA-binding transcriptional regulator [Agrococcus jenensis]ROR65200.1 LacI family transcriptional regulator [Agrococcus jenensis]
MPAADDRRAATAPSMADVAARVGVSIATVSNVLNHPERVRETTRRNVLAAIAEMGFVRNDSARSLAAGTSTAVGLVVADLGNSLFVEIARGAEHVMRQSGHDVVIVNSDVDVDRERHNLELMERTRVAGILFAPLDTPLARAGQLPTRAPTVFVNFESAGQPYSGVSVDERAGGALATQHLIQLGRKRLLFVGGPSFLAAVRDRRDGALAAAAAATGVTMSVIETRGLTVKHGRAIGDRILAAGAGEYDGIVAASDLLVIGLIQVLRGERGFTVPEDIAITGYDDNHLAAESDIPVTTVSQQAERMGEIAAELLLERMLDPDAAKRTAVVQPRLIPRRSTLGGAWRSD